MDTLFNWLVTFALGAIFCAAVVSVGDFVLHWIQRGIDWVLGSLPPRPRP